MSPERYACEWCGERLDPGDRVVQGLTQVTIETEQRGATCVDGGEIIYHEHDWDPAFGRETYRGPLRGLAPDAS